MWNKIYLLVLAVSIAVMAFFTFYSWSWLQSIGLPSAAWDSYLYHSGMAFKGLAFSTILLLLLGNVVLWISSKGWAMWITLIYFSLFVILKFFWLGSASEDFCSKNDLCQSPHPGFYTDLSIILILLMAAIVFFDQFAVVRLRRKIHPPIIDEDQEVETESSTE